MAGKKGLNFSLFLEDNQNIKNGITAYFYENPIEIISVTDPKNFKTAFGQMQKALAQGYHLAGWLSYEAGLLLELKLSHLIPPVLDYPLIHMGVFKKRVELNSSETNQYWHNHENDDAFSVGNIKLDLDRGKYDEAFNKIKEYLNAGDIYQVNLTQKVSFEFEGSRNAFYAALRKAQQVEYGAYIENDDLTVLSLSPELFIKKTKDTLVAKPMKGTCRRGRTVEEDEQKKKKLRTSEKEKAENLMIVDLLRNDLSKVAVPASVSVENLFLVEKYKTLFAMTSTIKAKLDDQYSALDLLKAIFPCGSVTGAPKIRAQQIIHELENKQRGIYTGAIGYITPENDMCFNVPIRTVTIDKKTNKGEMGVGGAIVADSVSENEYDECLLKTEFLTNHTRDFALIESFSWNHAEGASWLNLHLDRMEKSAKYFSFNMDRNQISNELAEHFSYIPIDKKRSKSAFKVRLLLSRAGDFSIISERIQQKSLPFFNFSISDTPVNSENPMIYHKTSDRGFYKRQLEKYHGLTGCDEVVFMNEKGELTEGSYTNLVIMNNGVYYSPPLKCGLLGGIHRKQMMENKKIKIVEKVLYKNDLVQADQIYLCNAIRGLVTARLV